MAITNASDLFVPQVAMRYARQQFVQSIELLSKMMGPSDMSPIQICNDPVWSSEGQTMERPLFARIGASLVTRRDITSNASVTPVKMTGVDETAVKLNRKIGPVDVSVDATRLSRATPEEFSMELGKQAGEEIALNMQTSIIAASMGAIAAMTATAHTSTVWAAGVRTNLSPSVLNGGLNLEGDFRERFRRTATMLFHSSVLQDLAGDAIGRGYQGVGDQALRGALMTNTLGMDWAMVDDNTYLHTTGGGFDHFYTLLLAAGFAQLWFTLPITIYPILQVLDQQQVVHRWRADFDFALGFHGMQYNVGAGGNNPTDGSLNSSANWTPVYSNHKEVKAVEIVHNYSGS